MLQRISHTRLGERNQNQGKLRPLTCRSHRYPVLIRPSYVLSGAAMNVVYKESALEYNLSAAASVSPLHPVVITKFIDNAQEIDVDAVAHKGNLLVHAVSEHVENAGVHSGDATLVLPPFSLTPSDLSRLKTIAEKVARAFDISGPFNMQIIKKPAEEGAEAPLKVIECNLRASRSFPFVSKVLGHNFIDTATTAIMDEDVPEPVDVMQEKRDYTAIKVAQFSWTRLGGADPFLGVGEYDDYRNIPLLIKHIYPRNGKHRRGCQFWERYLRSVLDFIAQYHRFQSAPSRIRCSYGR